MSGHGICKDCGNGTLNNAVHTQFVIEDDRPVCKRCGSDHIECELYDDSDNLFETEVGA